MVDPLTKSKKKHAKKGRGKRLALTRMTYRQKEKHDKVMG